MPDEFVPAMAAPARRRDNPLTRSLAGVLGIGFLTLMMVLCLGALPWTLRAARDGAGQLTGEQVYNAGSPRQGRMAPWWWPHDEGHVERAMSAIDPSDMDRLVEETGLSPEEIRAARSGPVYESARAAWPRYLLGSDALGRSLLLRCLTGDGISITIGLAAALISVAIGTLYGAVSGYVGGRVDALMMRIVDVLYGLPYILLVVLLAVATDAIVEEWASSRVRDRLEQRESYIAEQMSGADGEAERAILEERALELYGTGELTGAQKNAINVVTLLIAIGGVSWLTMARVVRGQVLSLKRQPFVEAARAVGSPVPRIFTRHLLPNLLGPIIVYTTLAVPQAILQESFLSFLGIGVKPPLPSWGNLAADGLSELNTYRSHWWLLLFPCVLLGLTLLSLNFVGEGLREAFDPRRARRA